MSTPSAAHGCVSRQRCPPPPPPSPPSPSRPGASAVPTGRATRQPKMEDVANSLRELSAIPVCDFSPRSVTLCNMQKSPRPGLGDRPWGDRCNTHGEIYRPPTCLPIAALEVSFSIGILMVYIASGQPFPPLPAHQSYAASSMKPAPVAAHAARSQGNEFRAGENIH